MSVFDAAFLQCTDTFFVVFMYQNTHNLNHTIATIRIENSDMLERLQRIGGFCSSINLDFSGQH